MKKFYLSAFLFIVFTLGAFSSHAQPGALDASFGNGGKVVTKVGDSSSVANSVAITTNGKILVGGCSFIAGQQVATLLQYNSDGTLDISFGTSGKVISSPGDQCPITSIALQSDSKIITGGYLYNYGQSLNTGGFLITRYNADGTLDSTFGNNGTTKTSFPTGLGYVKKIIVKPDGKILAGGGVSEFIMDNIPAFAQYLPNGMTDSSFGTNGAVTKGLQVFPGGITSGTNDVVLTATGKIVAVIDELAQGIAGTAFRLYQLLPNGYTDSAFGSNGLVRTNLSNGSLDDAHSAVILPDHSIVVAGESYSGQPAYITSIALVKYHSDGTLDSTFGTDGKVLTSIPNATATYGNHILSSPDGSLLVSGFTYHPTRDFVLVKYKPNGTLDSSFGTNGITITDFASSDPSYSSALQPDGKIVLAGSTGSDANYNIALARYTNALVYPLHLLSFTAVRNENNNILQWQTAQEINVSTFEVQRCGDGKTYSTIGYLKAGSNSYHFADNQPLLGNNYYRLKMIDGNGAFNYSPVKIINNSRSLLVQVYPNPAKSNLQVQINSDKETMMQGKIMANDGKILMVNQWLVQGGTSVKNINVTGLAKGNYYLVVTAKDKEQSVVKFEKL